MAGAAVRVKVEIRFWYARLGVSLVLSHHTLILSLGGVVASGIIPNPSPHRAKDRDSPC
jgi:hypothetical protein